MDILSFISTVVRPFEARNTFLLGLESWKKLHIFETVRFIKRTIKTSKERFIDVWQIYWISNSAC